MAVICPVVCKKYLFLSAVVVSISGLCLGSLLMIRKMSLIMDVDMIHKLSISVVSTEQLGLRAWLKVYLEG